MYKVSFSSRRYEENSMGTTKDYWVIELRVFTLESKQEAVELRDMLEDIIFDLPELKHLGGSSRILNGSDDD